MMIGVDRESKNAWWCHDCRYGREVAGAEGLMEPCAWSFRNAKNGSDFYVYYLYSPRNNSKDLFNRSKTIKSRKKHTRHSSPGPACSPSIDITQLVDTRTLCPDDTRGFVLQIVSRHPPTDEPRDDIASQNGNRFRMLICYGHQVADLVQAEMSRVQPKGGPELPKGHAAV
jgi:hypothetical protein